jgi:high affinity Mn2+ porin
MSRRDVRSCRDVLHGYLWRGVSASGGLQHIDYPGYNRDRGPIFVKMLRLHLDF